jgi:sugar phosphate isomerase/epimerase
MATPFSSLQTIPLSYATCSIVCDDKYALHKKLVAIKSAGFIGIELCMSDVLTFAASHLRSDVKPADYDDLATAARVIKAMCDAQRLKVLMLQPFANFEGWPEGSRERKEAFERAEGWIDIMAACGTDMLQVSS